MTQLEEHEIAAGKEKTEGNSAWNHFGKHVRGSSFGGTVLRGFAGIPWCEAVSLVLFLILRVCFVYR